MKRYLVIFIILFITYSANAQELLKGTVYELGTHEKLTNVFIHNTNNKQLTLADKDGKFEIKAATGNLIIFDSPGYMSDTLYVIDMKPKKIELKALSISLRQVEISAKRSNFNPREEYPQVYEKSKVYVLSPSTWFSKEGKDARRLKRYFATEAQERHIDEVYSVAYVGSIVPLKGQDLENFMSLYRPSYAFLRNNSGPSLAAYINDSYKKYMALPPDKRVVQSLTGN
ncbi:hypothetical protein [Mucilaginibacter sp.]|uniref:hypothetical protein n=1 Tax=Mucilaginibacter sp. TaxID=1882438 RepID=UPI0026305322|nr:hypothetical protein [Mucilaginibacter sp.]MDB4926843.1 hypothetical protein [Mucilaginibacter sp.]